MFAVVEIMISCFPQNWNIAVLVPILGRGQVFPINVFKRFPFFYSCEKGLMLGADGLAWQMFADVSPLERTWDGGQEAFNGYTFVKIYVAGLWWDKPINPLKYG